MKLLNQGYESETTGGSLYYNSGSGNCYSGQNNATQHVILLLQESKTIQQEI